MPFTQNDLQQAIGGVFIQFWGIQKQLEEAQEQSKLLQEQVEHLKAELASTNADPVSFIAKEPTE